MKKEQITTHKMKYILTNASLKTSSCMAITFDQASMVVQMNIVKNADPILSKLVIPKFSSSI